jgi:hypothetical protein
MLKVDALNVDTGISGQRNLDGNRHGRVFFW